MQVRDEKNDSKIKADDRAMNEILEKLKKTPGILSVVLTDKEGNLLYSSSSLDASPIVIAGLTSAFAGYLDEMLSNTGMGKLTDTIVNGSTGRVIISKLENGNILCVFMTASGNLGLVKFAISNTIQNLNNLKE